MKEAFVGIALLAVILTAYIALTPLQPVLYSDTYYGQLKAACAQSEGPACCESSVKTMEAQGYRLAEGLTRPDGYQCPAGQSVDRLKCIGSYRWCEPAATPTVYSLAGIEITYQRGGGLARWSQRIQLYENGTLTVHDVDVRYETDKAQILDAAAQARLEKLIQAADVDSLRAEYVCRFNCPTDLPFETIQIRTQNADKTIFIDDFDAVPPGLKELMKAFVQTADAIPTPTPAPVPLASQETANLAQTAAVQACGYDIRLTELGGATGSRNDWKHVFQIHDAQGTLRDTLQSWGNESHVMQSKLGFNVTVHGIDEPLPIQARQRTIQVSVQCPRVDITSSAKTDDVQGQMVFNGPVHSFRSFETITTSKGDTVKTYMDWECIVETDYCLEGGQEYIQLDIQTKDGNTTRSVLTLTNNDTGIIQGTGLRIVLDGFETDEKKPYQSSQGEFGFLANIRVYQSPNAGSKLQTYTACGCGCCGGTEPKTQCLYKAEGDDLQSIIDADQKAAQSPQCALVGCSLGTKYQYCD